MSTPYNQGKSDANSGEGPADVRKAQRYACAIYQCTIW